MFPGGDVKTILVEKDAMFVGLARWFSVGIYKYKPGYKSLDLL